MRHPSPIARSQPTSLLTVVLIALLLPLAACSGDALVSIHVTLAKDGSGTLTTRSLQAGTTPSPAETRTGGVDWALRATLVASQGAFAEIEKVTIGDGEVRFAPQLDGDRPGLRVTLARGPEAKWLTALTPAQEPRKQLAKAYDPSGRTAEIGELVRLEVVTPGAVITSGVLPSARGVEADRSGRSATLLLPVRTAREAGEPFVWDISWIERR